MNKRAVSINILVILAYIFLVGLLIFQLFALPDKYNKEEMDMIVEVEEGINEALQTSDATVMEQNISNMLETYNFDIVVTSGENVVLSTIPYEYGDALLNRSNKSIVAREAQGPYNNNGEELFLWYNVYRLNDSVFINAFLRSILFIVFIVTILLGMTVSIMAKILFDPLKNIKQSIKYAQGYDFNLIQETDDDINRSFKDFVSNLETNISAVSRQHTELEKQLQAKREHLNNIVVVSKSMVHDLKTPVYRNILENEVVAKEYYDNEQLVEMAQLNQRLNHDIMLDINRILNMLKKDGESFNIEKSEIDVINVLMRAINSFNTEMSKKGLYLNFDAPQSLMINSEESTLILLINNLLSNMVLYSEANTEMEIYVDIEDDDVLFRFINESTIENIEKMRGTEQLFNTVKNPDDDGYIYSSGNGLYLIKELTAMLSGHYALFTEDNKVIIEVRFKDEK